MSEEITARIEDSGPPDFVARIVNGPVTLRATIASGLAVPGPPGPVGPMGPQGETGPAGPQGPRGIQGVQGEQGIQGVTGPQGVEGPPGVGINTKGSVPNFASLPTGASPGDAYITEDTGDLWVWTNAGAWVNAGHIVGPEGPEGPMGPQGPEGVAGPQGVQGIQGLTGATGPKGDKGDTGDTGPQGVPGTPGSSIIIADEGGALLQRPMINFTGAGVVATDDAVNLRTNVTIAGGGVDIADEGVALPRRAIINFTGDGVTVTDDAANNRLVVTITGGTAGPPGGPAAYTNPGGTGARARIIAVTGSGAGYTGNPYSLIDGAAGTDIFFAGTAASAVQFTFDFYDAYVITEAKWLQSTAASHGTWKWQGSNDGSGWTDIGPSFTLGGATAQTIAELGGNTTAYRYYRLAGVSGNTSSGPYLHECEFKISVRTAPVNGTLYNVLGGSGDRTAIITVTTDLATGGPGGITTLVNGAFANGVYLAGEAVAGKFIRFDFGAPKLVDECAWYQSQNATHGTWKWQRSGDGSAWTDIGSAFTLGGGDNAGVWLQRQRELRANAASFRYYRLLGVSGNSSNSPYLYEAEFRIA